MKSRVDDQSLKDWWDMQMTYKTIGHTPKNVIDLNDSKTLNIKEYSYHVSMILMMIVACSCQRSMCFNIMKPLKTCKPICFKPMNAREQDCTLPNNQLLITLHKAIDTHHGEKS
jgi:hypothetical protein